MLIPRRGVSGSESGGAAAVLEQAGQVEAVGGQEVALAQVGVDAKTSPTPWLTRTEPST